MGFCYNTGEGSSPNEKDRNVPMPACDVTAKMDALRRSRYFQKLQEEALVRLSQRTALHGYTRGEVIFWEGDPCAGLCILHKGSVKLFKTSPNGREFILKVFEEGDTFNEVPVFDHGGNPVSAAALEECEIWVVETEAIHEVMAQDHAMCSAVVQNLAANLRMMVDLVDELSFYQVTNRLARLINQLPSEQLVGETTTRITQDQMAARLGTVREVVARSLRELERSGAIRVRRRQIHILDREALNDWAQGPLN